jgi:hypothetical protein
MSILDFGPRDMSAVLLYLSSATTNPCPASFDYCPDTIAVTRVTDPTHPANTPNCRCGITRRGPGDLHGSVVQLGNQPRIEPIIKSSVFPLGLVWARQMAGACAVGLPWLLSYPTDVNPPFRRSMLPGGHSLLVPLLWSIGFGPDNVLDFGRPSPACDSLLVFRTDGASIHWRHVHALWKYLRFTEPHEWSRRGPAGFEAYWKTYARAFGEEECNTSPYELGVEEYQPPNRRWRIIETTARLVAWMTLENIPPEDEVNREGIERTRLRVLATISTAHSTRVSFPIGPTPGPQ